MNHPRELPVGSLLAFVSKARALKAAAPLRSRTAKMDAFVQQVGSSPRFSIEAAAAAVNRAVSDAKTESKV